MMIKMVKEINPVWVVKQTRTDLVYHCDCHPKISITNMPVTVDLHNLSQFQADYWRQVLPEK